MNDEYDAIYPLGHDRRIGIRGNQARVENIKTGEVGAWYTFDYRPELTVLAIHQDKLTEIYTVHYNDGSYRRFRFENLVLSFEQRVFPQWKEKK